MTAMERYVQLGFSRVRVFRGRVFRVRAVPYYGQRIFFWEEMVVRVVRAFRLEYEHCNEAATAFGR